MRFFKASWGMWCTNQYSTYTAQSIYCWRPKDHSWSCVVVGKGSAVRTYQSYLWQQQLAAQHPAWLQLLCPNLVHCISHTGHCSPRLLLGLPPAKPQPPHIPNSNLPGKAGAISKQSSVHQDLTNGSIKSNVKTKQSSSAWKSPVKIPHTVEFTRNYDLLFPFSVSFATVC